MRVPLNSGGSHTVGMYLIPSSSLHSQCVDNSFTKARIQHCLQLTTDSIAFPPQLPCFFQQRSTLFTTSANPNSEACLSKKHWNLGCLSHRFLGKLFIFLPGLTSFPTSFMTLRRFLWTFSCPMSHMPTSIALRSQFPVLHFRSESPRCGGRRRFRRRSLSFENSCRF